MYAEIDVIDEFDYQLLENNIQKAQIILKDFDFIIYTENNLKNMVNIL